MPPAGQRPEWPVLLLVWVLPAEKALFKSPSVASIYHLLSVPQLVLLTLIAAAGRGGGEGFSPAGNRVEPTTF
jgi:hypothetical protein